MRIGAGSYHRTSVPKEPREELAPADIPKFFLRLVRLFAAENKVWPAEHGYHDEKEGLASAGGLNLRVGRGSVYKMLIIRVFRALNKNPRRRAQNAPTAGGEIHKNRASATASSSL